VAVRKDASVCVVLRAPSREEAPVWHVVDYARLVDENLPVIQSEIENAHTAYPGPTVIEANSIGQPIIQNLRLPADELIEHTTTQASKRAMLTEIEILLQEGTLKIHSEYSQLLTELRNYRLPDVSIAQDSVMALGFAVSNRHQASSSATGGRILVDLMRKLNGRTRTPPTSWLDQQKITTDGPWFGLVRLNPRLRPHLISGRRTRLWTRRLCDRTRGDARRRLDGRRSRCSRQAPAAPPRRRNARADKQLIRAGRVTVGLHKGRGPRSSRFRPGIVNPLRRVGLLETLSLSLGRVVLRRTEALALALFAARPTALAALPRPPSQSSGLARGRSEQTGGVDGQADAATRPSCSATGSTLSSIKNESSSVGR
jgi:hypothetical protein